MKKLCVVLGCALLLLTGCKPSDIDVLEKSVIDTPDMNIYERGIEIDWDQVKLDWNDSFADSQIYPFVHSLDYVRDDDAETLDIYIYVQPGTKKEEAAAYATEAVKGLNDSVYMQDFSFAQSSLDSYGSFVTIYDVTVVVAPYDTKDDKTTWLIEEQIEAMEYREISAE